MVDELKTDKMESFVGNDPRSLFNLVLHMLDVSAPVRVENINSMDLDEVTAASSVSGFFDTAIKDVARQFRRSGPRQSINRTRIGYLLATGWYAEFSIITDDGNRAYTDIWNPAEVYPLWDGDGGLSEVAHITSIPASKARLLSTRNGWSIDRIYGRSIKVYDYWWAEHAEVFPFQRVIFNAIVIDTKLVKFAPTRFINWPIYTAPVGGLPDMGALSEGSELSNSNFNAGAFTRSERWKEDIGQAIVATNEHIYRTWNKWWSFSLQLLRDTAQPRIFERSRSGKSIVKPEDVFRRGAIFRGGPDDSVEFMASPAMPLELRSTQLDLEAMMQRGGVNWSMFGAVQGRMSAIVMSQIAASANQIMKPFHQAIVNLNDDEANDWLDDIRHRNISPYGWKLPTALPEDAILSTRYEVEIPGDIVQRVTVARMADPDFRLSYSYVIEKFFPDIKDRLKERAMVRTDIAEMHPTNAVIALIEYYRQQAAFLRNSAGDEESAKLYDMAAEAALAQLGGQQEQQQQPIPSNGTSPQPIPAQLRPPRVQ
tara:strand:- start:11117 stop:12736 length:1620 start_codon:yes stop_codon:yes gene_type:complete